MRRTATACTFRPHAWLISCLAPGGSTMPHASTSGACDSFEPVSRAPRIPALLQVKNAAAHLPAAYLIGLVYRLPIGRSGTRNRGAEFIGRLPQRGSQATGTTC